MNYTLQQRVQLLKELYPLTSVILKPANDYSLPVLGSVEG